VVVCHVTSSCSICFYPSRPLFNSYPDPCPSTASATPLTGSKLPKTLKMQLVGSVSVAGKCVCALEKNLTLSPVPSGQWLPSRYIMPISPQKTTQNQIYLPCVLRATWHCTHKPNERMSHQGSYHCGKFWVKQKKRSLLSANTYPCFLYAFGAQLCVNRNLGEIVPLSAPNFFELGPFVYSTP